MKHTGIIRTPDQLGRVVVPMEWRRRLGWSDTTPVEITCVGDTIVMQKCQEAPIVLLAKVIDDAKEAGMSEPIIAALSNAFEAMEAQPCPTPTK